jgi:DNA-binding CsgD family transcriptional regulator
VNDQEIRSLCEVVIAVYTSFSALLQDKGLSDKDFQFCCLVKSGLSTFELAEIYCVSESAIFKRKQKLKEKLGYKSEKRTLDEILQAM